MYDQLAERRTLIAAEECVWPELHGEAVIAAF
jgi:hypothetical protein